jgi:hypothetical protein
VCYDFFCDTIGEDARFRAEGLQTIVREFIMIGNKALGNTHLVCVENLKSISTLKIEKMLQKIDLLAEKITQDARPPEAGGTLPRCAGMLDVNT